MSFKYFYLLGIIIHLSAVPVFSASYPFKTAHHVRTTTATMTDIYEEVFTEINGNEYREATWREQKMPYGQGKERTFTLMEEDTLYNVNLDTMEGTKQDIKKTREAFLKEGDPEKFSEQLKEQLSAVKIGRGEGAGYPCTIYEYQQMGKVQICLYKDFFPLWQEGMGSSMKVIEFNPNAKIPAEKMELPSGVTWTKAPDVNEILKGMKGREQSPHSGRSYDRSSPQSPPQPMTKEEQDKKMNEAIKQYEKAMQQLQKMFPEQGQSQ